LNRAFIIYFDLCLLALEIGEEKKVDNDSLFACNYVIPLPLSDPKLTPSFFLRHPNETKSYSNKFAEKNNQLINKPTYYYALSNLFHLSYSLPFC
jgi:hypothetical protein